MATKFESLRVRLRPVLRRRLDMAQVPQSRLPLTLQTWPWYTRLETLGARGSALNCFPVPRDKPQVRIPPDGRAPFAPAALPSALRVCGIPAACPRQTALPHRRAESAFHRRPLALQSPPDSIRRHRPRQTPSWFQATPPEVPGLPRTRSQRYASTRRSARQPP